MNRLDLRSNTGVRLAISSIISLLLIIPAGMISDLIIEREMRRNEAVQEINQNGGRPRQPWRHGVGAVRELHCKYPVQVVDRGKYAGSPGQARG